MLTKNRIKQLASLRDSKSRHEQGLFLVEGVKWVSEMLHSDFFLEEVIATTDWAREHLPLLHAKEIPLQVVSEAELKKVSSLVTPNAVIAVVRIPKVTFNQADIQSGLSLMLDGIRDPGNLGTIIRIADWFGIRHILCSHECVDLYNPKVIQASMGSLMRVRVTYHDLPGFLESLPPGIPVYGAVLDGENIMNEKLQSPGILVIGNESRGISPQLLSFVSRRIKIPAFGEAEAGGKAESLNASVAAALICYEFRRGDSLQRIE